jgi:large subunit ribosomal protein L25
MEQVTLRAQRRVEAGTRPSRRLRRAGMVPGVVYGRGSDTVPVAVNSHDLYVALHTDAGLNALINVEVEGGDTVLAVARELQYHPVRGEITHLDFIKVSLDEAIEAEVALDFVGTPPGVTDEGGFVEMIANAVLIEALPTTIPSSITLSIDELHIGDTLKVSDLPVVDGVTYLDDADRPLVTVLAPREEIEEAPTEEELEEGEEAAEGEEGAEEEAAEDEEEG